ncbi:MAG: 16S rRNA (cytosine(967)-C(5))-methyltransferase RsmB [Candidatus Auribacterota bacterium]|nr:16S rRNA (cytosine(967)-C(5))-methyltransferase RsmB [Candidatus Auribacterota bacterium]
MKKSNRHLKNSSKRIDNNPRMFAYHLLHEAATGSIVTDSLGDRIAESQLNEPDRRLAYDIVINCIRRRLTLDYLIHWYSNRDIDSIDLPVRAVLWIGFYQLRYMDKIPPHAAVSESVETAKQVAGKGASGFVNAILRNCLRSPQTAEDRYSQLQSLEKLAFRESHPLWLIERWSGSMDADKLEAFCEFNNRKPPLVVRVHTANISVCAFAGQLSNCGVYYEKSPVHPDCFRIFGSYNVEHLPGYADGWFAVQDETTLRVIDRIDVRTGHSILDMCAAPGGKTAYLAQQTGITGRVVAVDSNKRRMRQLADTISRLRMPNVTTVVADGTDYDALTKQSIMPGSFDRVVVDAPCSNTGVLRKRPEARWRLCTDDFARLADLQKKLLNNAAEFVNKDGILLYSTCSIDREENEAVADSFISINRSFEMLERTTFLPAQPTDPDGGFCAVFRKI